MDRRAPLKPVQRAILLSLAIGLPVWFVYVFYRMPRLSNLPRMFFVPEPLSAALLSLIFGLAVSAILVLFMANRRRMGSVLKPNRGRLIVAAFLGFTMHIWNAEFMPIVPIGLAIALLPESFLFFVLFVFLGALLSVLWYIPSCLIVSGVRSKPCRVALVALFWLGTASGCILIFGVTDLI